MANLVNILKAAGFRDQALRDAYGIAMRESGGNADAHNTDASTGDNSYGLFPINMLGNLGPERDAKFRQYVKGYTGPESLFNPLVNARAALYMSKHGVDWSSWVSPTYGSAAQYREQFDAAEAAAPEPTSDVYDELEPQKDKETGEEKPQKLTKRSLAAQFDVSWDYVRSHPELLSIFQEAADNPDINTPQGLSNFSKAIQQSSWYRDNSQYMRKYLLAQSAGGQDFQDDLTEARTAVQQEAARIGAVLAPDQLDAMAKQYLMNGWYDAQSGRDKMLTQALTGQLDGFSHDYLNYQAGGATALVSAMKKTAQQNGVTYDESFYQNAAKIILSGMDTIDSYTSQIRDKAAGLYPVYADRIKAGEDVSDIASPYRNLIEQTLELAPGSVQLNDPWMQKAMGSVDPTTGKRQEMDMGDLLLALRNDPRYGSTQAYLKDYGDALSQVFSGMGLR